MLTLVVFCAHTVLGVAAVLVVGRSRIQRAYAALFLVCGFILEWFAPFDSCLRAILAWGGMIALAATIKSAASATPRWPVWNRLLDLVSVPYPLRAGRTRPTLSLPIIGRFILEGLFGSAALLTLWQTTPAAHSSGAIIAVFRLIAGVIFLYAMLEFLTDFFFLAAGVSLHSIHRAPIAARSLREFWGQRWNRIASALLHRFVFLPLARRHRPSLGLFCACLVSGVLHAWPAMVALGAFAAFTTATFFCLQGVLILAEDRLHVHAWPVLVARTWTLVILLASSPLVIDPFLRMFHL